MLKPLRTNESGFRKPYCPDSVGSGSESLPAHWFACGFTLPARPMWTTVARCALLPAPTLPGAEQWLDLQFHGSRAVPKHRALRIGRRDRRTRCVAA
jgi:hypothetical protein